MGVTISKLVALALGRLCVFGKKEKPAAVHHLLVQQAGGVEPEGDATLPPHPVQWAPATPHPLFPAKTSAQARATGMRLQARFNRPGVEPRLLRFVFA
jgi:hypothetical protein